MRRLAALALAVSLPAAPAGADDEPALPAPNVASAHLDGTIARVVMHFDVGLVGPNEVAGMSVAIPHRAVVTGGTATVGGVAHRLQLLEAQTATNAFEAVVAAPAGPDRGSAIVLANESRGDSVSIDVVTPKQARLELTLELEMPTCFFRDARYVVLPVAARPGLAPDVARAVVAHPEAIADSCGGAAEDVWLELGTRDADAPRIATIGQRLPLPRADFAHVELDLAREMSDVPRDLHTAIVIDGSRSLLPEEAEVQRAVVAAYLRAVPQSHVQVIAYARGARALLPGWTGAAAGAARVDRELRALELRNGSNVDAGLAAAGEWLARVDGTRRVIVLTDERIGDRLANANAAGFAGMLPEGTLVHVVTIETGDGAIERDDGVTFAPLAVVTEGLSARAHAGDKGVIDATILARPISLDKLAVAAPGWEAAGTNACALSADPMSLPEGHACAWTGQGTSAAGPVTLTGFLWNKRFTRVVRPDPAGARTLARSLSTDDSIATEVQLDVDRAAFALNAVWSLYASWGGKAGYSEGEGFGTIGTGSFSTCGCDGGDIGHGFGTGIGVHLDLRAQLAGAITACHAGDAHVEIDLETTGEEIVDVGVKTTDPALHDCVVERVWDTFLAIPNAPSHIHTRVVF